MTRKKLTVLLLILGLAAVGLAVFSKLQPSPDAPIISYRARPGRQHIRLYWKDDQDNRLGSLQNLKAWLAGQHETLLFAMNGGMFRPDYAPVGLFIQNRQILAPLNTGAGAGNFYLKPNGIFYLTAAHKAAICTTPEFKDDGRIAHATQSGPMLVINGRIHPAFRPDSRHLNIRNGVGILPDGDVVFALSSTEINFYDFADYFRKLGCKNALYLDGFVSRAYAPSQNWTQTDGDFGVIIGVTAKPASVK